MIDVIIPVYNGFDVITPCMESVIAYTDLNKNRVVLVNDCSPDERILPILKNYCAKSKNIILINSSKNEGFSASVNKGICHSRSNDVVLLNSDTIVTRNWLEKISNCAYSRPEISTVTPLSNAATLCSVPEMCVDNDLPENFTIDEFAELVELKSLHKYPEISVAVGFCMFIKREVINQVGLFDAKTFGKGYGEENDFCNRAQQLGYVDVMCDDTFIYHSGSASFIPEQKKGLCEQHDKILRMRYPKQMQRNSIYCTTRPDQDIRDNLNIYIPFHNGKKNLLFVAHCGFGSHYSLARGGVQYHIKDLVTYMKKDFNVFLAARNGNSLTLSAYTENTVSYFDFPIFEIKDFERLLNSKMADIWTVILKSFDIDLVHVHHTITLSDDIFYVAKAFNIPVLFTIHDYFYLCPNYKLFKNKENFCNYEINDKSDCNECLSESLCIYNKLEYKDFWQSKKETILRSCKKTIFPSEYARNIFEKKYFLENALVIEHGSDDFQTYEPVSLLQTKYTKMLKTHIDTCQIEKNKLIRISGWAYLEGKDSSETEIYLRFTSKDGSFCVKKATTMPSEYISNVYGHQYRDCGFCITIASGDKNFIEKGIVEYQVMTYCKKECVSYVSKEKYSFKMLASLKKNDALRLAFIGGITKEKGSDIAYTLINATKNLNVVWYCFSDVLTKPLSELNADNFVFYGSYEREELHNILDSLCIDVVCILPIWGETFCYTLSEALYCKRPVIATNIGAVGERVKKYDCGWLVSVENAVEETKEIIQSLLSDRFLLENKRQQLDTISLKTTDEMCAEYRELYDSLLMDEKKKMDDVIKDESKNNYSKRILEASYAANNNSPAMHIIKLENSLNSVNAELNAMRNSLSWRITKPLRKIKRTLKNLLSK